MKDLINTNWVDKLINHIALKVYENEQKKHRKSIQNAKRKIINHHRIIVKVNNEVIYDSKKEKDMSDGLYFALLSYGLMQAIDADNKNKKPINYNITPSISVLPEVFNKKAV